MGLSCCCCVCCWLCCTCVLLAKLLLYHASLQHTSTNLLRSHHVSCNLTVTQTNLTREVTFLDAVIYNAFAYNALVYDASGVLADMLQVLQGNRAVSSSQLLHADFAHPATSQYCTVYPCIKLLCGLWVPAHTCADTIICPQALLSWTS